MGPLAASILVLSLSASLPVDMRTIQLRLQAGESDGTSSLAAIRPYGNVWDYMTWGAGEWQ